MDSILKVRFYSDGQFTLNGEQVEFSEFSAAAKYAASNGGAVWVWSESGELTDFEGEVIKEMLGSAVLRLVFSSDEEFSSLSLSDFDVVERPANALLLNDEEEFQQCAGNLTEFYLYLGTLQVCFDAFFNNKQHADDGDAGIYFIYVAVRKNASKFWLVHPGAHDDEYYQPLMNTLEIQPLPSMNEGEIAFAIANKRPLDPAESLKFDVVFPNEWVDITKKWGRAMSIAEILDAIWPADSLH